MHFKEKIPLYIQEATTAANMAKSYLVRQRDDSAFDSFYSCAIEQAKQYTEDPVIPRYKKPPKRYYSGYQPHRFSDVRAFYRSQYYEVIDLLNGEITRRFDQASLPLPASIEDILVKATSDLDESPLKVPNVVAAAYSKDINMTRLEKQLQMMPDLAST